MSGMGGMMMTGMALGAGSEIGHQAVRGAMGAMSGGSGHGEASQQQQQMAPAQGNAPMDNQMQQQQNPCA